MTHEQLLQCLADLAEKGGFTSLGNSAAFNLSQDGDNKGVLPGAVYCIALPASSREAVSIHLETEAKTKLSLRTPLERIRKLVVDQNEAIPLYWGKDAAVGYRLYRHLLDKKPKAGCLGGRFYASLKNTEIIAASLPVNDFIAFEKFAEERHPSMLFNVKASNIGRFT